MRNKNEIKNENYYLMRYLNGYDGIELDEKMAIKLFRKSAELGYPKARKILKKLESGK